MTESQHSTMPTFAITEEGLKGRWFIRPNDFEQMFGIKATTVRDAIYRGDLPARKFRGRGWLIATSDARRWIEEQTTPSEVALRRLT